MMISKSRITILITVLALFMNCNFFVTGCRKSAPPKTATAKTTKTVSMSDELKKITKSARTWTPILTETYTKPMTDFKFTDITGKEHSIAQYKDKSIMIVMWATWCGPCKQEIPHIITLRNIIGDDKLAIIAISNESSELVKQTAEKTKMNYTVVAYKGLLPKPLSSIRGYPTSFFINPDGTIKIVTEGQLHLGDMKAIINAK